jgi:hypothetical protein
VVRRLNHPGKPTILVDEGPALGLYHRYDLMRKDLDVALAAPIRKGRTPRLYTDLGRS